MRQPVDRDDEDVLVDALDASRTDEDLGRLAEALAESLEDVGWYADFRSETETFVVFSGRVFRYASGDSVARAKAESYAREHGVPDTQIDWS